MPIFNPGFFTACPELALMDWFIGVGLSMVVYMLPAVLAIMLVQRS